MRVTVLPRHCSAAPSGAGLVNAPPRTTVGSWLVAVGEESVGAGGGPISPPAQGNSSSEMTSLVGSVEVWDSG
jgi:hypothetical protein